MKILQIGCHVGDDHVFDYVISNLEKIEKIYLLDANPKCIDISKEKYKNISCVEFLNYAIVSDENVTNIDLYIPFNDDISAHASVLEFHLTKHGHNNINTINVEAKTFNNLLNELEIDVLDRLYIDTEGLDIDIINSINFDRVNINYLMFEYIHSDGPLSWGGNNLNMCLEKLKLLEFTISTEEYNIIATKF